MDTKHIAVLGLSQCGASTESVNYKKDMSNWNMFIPLGVGLVRVNAISAVRLAKRFHGGNFKLYRFDCEFNDYNKVMANAKLVGEFKSEGELDILNGIFPKKVFYRV